MQNGDQTSKNIIFVSGTSLQCVFRNSNFGIKALFE